MTSADSSNGTHLGVPAPEAPAATSLDPWRIMEALFFTGGAPVTASQIARLLNIAEEDVVRSVARLNRDYFLQRRPYAIRRAASGYQMVLRGPFASTVRRLQGRSREVRLSVAAIEVLALVAYRQPVTLQVIDGIRGVDSAAIVRQLRRRNLIEQAGTVEGQKRQEHFRTTKRFMELFQLKSMDDLPRVQDLEKA